MKLCILGSTGSIGTQALDVLRFHAEKPRILCAGSNVTLLEEQARLFGPRLCCMADEQAGRDLRIRLADTPIEVTYGEKALLDAAGDPCCDTVLNAVVGVRGLAPTLAALSAGKRLLLANKESLVYGGGLLKRFANAEILPVDSEHSAIFQCLQNGKQGLRRLWLTASGGPFWGYSKAQQEDITPEMALKHPNWSMGAKVTVDSATLLNKGLELIEAMYLFSLPPERIEVVVHPESIIHSLVEYDDGAMLAQLGRPDMRLPIQYALFYPERRPCPGEPLDLRNLGTLRFAPPDLETFPCLALAMEAAKQGGNKPAVLCGAGEQAVTDFLQGKLRFPDIPRRIEAALQRVPFVPEPEPEDLWESDALARQV